MKKKNDYIKSIVVLGVICLVIAVLLAAVNSVTAPIIEENASNNANASLKVVLPDAEDFEALELPDGSPDTVTAIYKDTGGTGFAVTLATSSSYSATPMTFTLGIGADGKIVAVEMTNYAETKDFGDYPQTYVGEDSALGGVDMFAGATYSSTAFKNAVQDAFTVLTSTGAVAEGEKSDEQKIEELKAKLLPGAVDRAGKVHMSTESVTDSSGIIEQAFAAENGTGYIYVANNGGETLMCAVSSTGSIQIVNLDGDDVTDDNSAVADVARAASDFSKDADKNLATALKAVNEGVNISPIKASAQQGKIFGSITAAYITDTAEAPQYVFICQPYGYREPMKLVFTVDVASGTILNFRAASELIQESDYYTDYTLDPEAYKNGIIGMTPETLNSDATLISGATMTSGGVNEAINDVFAALKIQWEVAQ